MAVRIRLKRLGRRNRAFWRICATDKRAARDGKVIEELGWYDPHLGNEEKVRLDRDRVRHWLKVGATPSETVEQLLLHVGINTKGDEVDPRPWPKKKTPPPLAAPRVAAAKAAETADAAEADAGEAATATAEAPAPEAEATEAEAPAPAEDAAEAPAEKADEDAPDDDTEAPKSEGQ